jgi:hypothetical protein
VIDAFASALEQAEAIRRRDVSPAELVNIYLDRIDRFNRNLNAYWLITPELASRQAVAAERQLADGNASTGPLHGVPVSVKISTPSPAIQQLWDLGHSSTTSWTSTTFRSPGSSRQVVPSSAKPPLPNSVSARLPNTACTGSPATPGAWRTMPAAPVAARLRPLPPASAL